MDTIDNSFIRRQDGVLEGALPVDPPPAEPGLRKRLLAGAASPRRWRLPTRDKVKALARRFRRGLIALGIFAAGVVGFVTLVATAPEVQRAAKPERVWSVDAITVASADHQPEITTLGTVVPGREADLRSLVPGTVLTVSPALRNGGVVKAGDVLLTIEPLDYELALRETAAQLAEAEARLSEFQTNVATERQQLDLRQRELARQQELFRNGTASASRLEQTQLAFNQAENALKAQQARVAQQEAMVDRLRAGRAKAEMDLARTRLVAPFDGFVGSVNAEQGMRLSPADRVASLSGAEGLEARVTLPTDAYGRLVADGKGLIGRPAKVEWSLGNTTLTYPATVDRVVDRIDTATGGVGVFVRLENTVLDQPLRPGAFVRVSIPDQLYQGVVRLPVTAVHGEDTVYVVGADNRLEARKVEVGARSADSIFVVSGLQPGAQVVTTRFQEIGGGLKVNVRGAETPTPAQPAGGSEQKEAAP